MIAGHEPASEPPTATPALPSNDEAGRIRSVLARVGGNPDLYPEVESGVRRAPVRRFPYGVLYRRRGGRVEVIAVFHDRRDPAIWQGRV